MLMLGKWPGLSLLKIYFCIEEIYVCLIAQITWIHKNFRRILIK